MSRFNVNVTRVLFPHPRRCKFEVDYPEPVGSELVEGVQAWICYKATKEEAAKIDTAAVLEAYIEQGALPGSRVTVELIPTETVRAAEITEKHRLREKVEVYAEASGDYGPGAIGKKVPESILLKADQLEREAEERGAAAGMHFRLRRLRLRGAIGVWKGQRKDEVDYNLDAFSPGLIAMVGVNGSSKSTVIENMHPYPCMLTRDGKLQDHFRLRDSARELWFVDERTGAEYRALMEIDGANASGLANYHLFKNGEPINSGAKLSKDEYEQAIEGLIGTLPLFLRSAFVSQRPTKSNPDLSEATKGERKAIFRELAGLDYMQAYAESAKAKASAIEAEIAVERGRISVIESQLTALPGITRDRDSAAADLGVRNLALEKLAATGSTLKAEAEQLSQKVAEQRSLAERIAGLEDQIAQKQQVIKLAQASITDYQEALTWKPEAEKVIAEWDALKEQENAENRRLSAINADNARLQGEYTTRLTAHNADVRKVEGQQSGLRTEKASLEGTRNVLQAQIGNLKEWLAPPKPCPQCGYIDPEIIKKREELEKTLDEKVKKSEEARIRIQKTDLELAAIVPPPALPPFVLAPADQAPLRRILTALAVLKIDQARKNVATAQEAATRIEEAKKQLEKASGDQAELELSIQGLQSQIDPAIQPVYDEAARKLEAARVEYGEAQKAIAGLEAQIQGLGKRIAELQASEKDLGERKVTLEERQACAAEWRYLETACGPDGIQALELDAMGPGISDCANKLLSAAYGSRFSIELRTTRIAGKGSKTKQVEDFAIIVLDNELLTEQPIETLSGGESVWIKRALYDAFALIRDRTTGIRFLTVFADEADGALDPESRQHYFAMLEAAHQESGRRHTLVVTHSPEIQEMIPQKIEMRSAE